MILIGGLIAGITTIRAHVLPSIIGWMILITSVLLLLSFLFIGLLSAILTNRAAALFYAALAWAGATLSFQVNVPSESGHMSGQ